MTKERFLELCKKEGLLPVDSSFQEKDRTMYVYCDNKTGGMLAVRGLMADTYIGEYTGEIKFCPLTEANATLLGRAFPWMLPVSMAGHDLTVGFGDRLGIVTEAHIASIEGMNIFPVLAQQSKRELSLTGRTFSSMVADVSWQVFKCGYKGGFAADGDHLKTLEEVKQAVSWGATMITLDCSEHIDNSVGQLNDAQLKALCAERFELKQLDMWVEKYAGKSFQVGSGQVSFAEEDLYRIIALYGKALDFIEKIYKEIIIKAPAPVAFEISIDETYTTTAPNAHFFVASELLGRSISFESMAPRFCGEFQKGVDYIGDLEQLDREVEAHAKIAEHFGYRISVHSGSDKFSAFPIIGKHCGGRMHLKTSGTSWVEALRVIAGANPSLFRQLMHCAMEHFEEAKAYYHVSASVNKVPMPESVADKNLPALMDEVDTRQVMHITYGFQLQETGPDGKYLYRDAIYKTLYENSGALREIVVKHFVRHYKTLGVERR